MTIDEFFAHVQSNGFQGYSPGKSDVLGDTWSRRIGELFDRVCDLPIGNHRHTVWLVWQWLYCELAGMGGRTIASPPAIRACGFLVDDATVSDAVRLLLASQSFVEG